MTDKEWSAWQADQRMEAFISEEIEAFLATKPDPKEEVPPSFFEGLIDKWVARETEEVASALDSFFARDTETGYEVTLDEEFFEEPAPKVVKAEPNLESALDAFFEASPAVVAPTELESKLDA